MDIEKTRNDLVQTLNPCDGLVAKIKRVNSMIAKIDPSVEYFEVVSLVVTYSDRSAFEQYIKWIESSGPYTLWSNPRFDAFGAGVGTFR